MIRKNDEGAALELPPGREPVRGLPARFSLFACAGRRPGLPSQGKVFRALKAPGPRLRRLRRNLSKKQLVAVSKIGYATAPGQHGKAALTVREAHSEQEGKFPTKQARLFFGEFSLLFFMPGSFLAPIDQTGGSKSGLRSALHRRDGSRGFERPENLPLG